MIKKLLDETENISYFVYLTNRGDAFPKIGDSLEEIYTNLREEVTMGYTDLWVLKRVGLLNKHDTFYFSENDRTADDELKRAQYLPEKIYITFTFVQINEATSPMYTNSGGTMTHLTYEEAEEYAVKHIDKMKQKYPEREFYVLYARLVERNTWH